MRKKRIRLILLAVLLIVVVGGVAWRINQKPDTSVVTLGDYKNISYIIEGRSVTLTNGVSVSPVAPGSATTVTTRYFGNEAHGDLNGDGKDDVAFLVTQDGGGSGTFYYVVAAVATNNGYSGTNAILLGDRIAPQTTEIRSGTIIVNYADRKADDPMSVPASIGVSKYLKLSGAQLVEVSK